MLCFYCTALAHHQVPKSAHAVRINKEESLALNAINTLQFLKHIHLINAHRYEQIDICNSRLQI